MFGEDKGLKKGNGDCEHYKRKTRKDLPKIDASSFMEKLNRRSCKDPDECYKVDGSSFLRNLETCSKRHRQKNDDNLSLSRGTESKLMDRDQESRHDDTCTNNTTVSCPINVTFILSLPVLSHLNAYYPILMLTIPS